MNKKEFIDYLRSPYFLISFWYMKIGGVIIICLLGFTLISYMDLEPTRDISYNIYIIDKQPKYYNDNVDYYVYGYINNTNNTKQLEVEFDTFLQSQINHEYLYKCGWRYDICSMQH